MKEYLKLNIACITKDIETYRSRKTEFMLFPVYLEFIRSKTSENTASVECKHCGKLLPIKIKSRKTIEFWKKLGAVFSGLSALLLVFIVLSSIIHSDFLYVLFKLSLVTCFILGIPLLNHNVNILEKTGLHIKQKTFYGPGWTNHFMEENRNEMIAMFKANEFAIQGSINAKQEKWDLAKINLEKAVRLNPNHPEAHMALALTYGALRQMDLAKKHYQELKRLDPQLATEFEDTPAGTLIVRGGDIIEI